MISTEYPWQMQRLWDFNKQLLSRDSRQSEGSVSEVFPVLHLLVVCEIFPIQFNENRIYLQVGSLLLLL